VMTIDSSTAYGSAASGDWYASRSGGPVTLFGSVPCTRVAAGGGWLYCMSDGLRKLQPLSQEVETAIEGDVRDFVLSPKNIYASVGEDLEAVPRSGGNGYVLGTYASISAVTVDDQSVYFVNTDSNLGLLLSTAL